MLIILILRPNTVSEFVPMLLAITCDDSKRQKHLDHGKEGNLRCIWLVYIYLLMTVFQIQLLKETSTSTY